MIEQGRHKKLSLQDRICPLCKTDVEDEFHFVIKCRMLCLPRSELFTKIEDIIPSFIDLDEKERFKLLMSPNDIDICKVCVDGINKMYELRAQLINAEPIK